MSTSALPPTSPDAFDIPMVSLRTHLNAYYQEIKTVILSRQNPLTGLLPASTAVNTHGNYTDAWVRDNVYSILAAWGLALAYRKIDDDRGQGYELEHSVVKLMRGLLFAMMRQSPKVEQFKQTQDPLDALHAKYDLTTGDTVVGDDEWGHLQLDATSLYLLMLAQMTASGLQIIFTLDEVNFIQNLVYYIGRAYRTPDYGIWERGNKMNHGKPELNASSIGMAKAALEAMNGLNLFGVRGSQASVLHVLPDEIARTRITLDNLLPRESASKEVDAALLSVIGYPAFAVDDPALVERTRQNIMQKLEGRYGCKRFLRDGHQTVIEDVTRLHYEPTELKQFEHIECEWPLFFTYLMLDAVFRGDRPMAQAYQNRLNEVMVQRDGLSLLPELYYVPEALIDAEKANPHSQPRQPNDNIPLVWAQSLYYLGRMVQDGLLALGDLDPLGRHLHGGRRSHPVVQIALLAEDEALRQELADLGIATQTPSQLVPIQVRQAGDLADVYTQIGRNDKLNLTGRPKRRLRSLTTSRIFRIRGATVVFLPSFLDRQQFYLTLDYHFLVAQIKGEVAYIHQHWSQPGRPLMTLLLTHDMFQEKQALLELIRELQDGHCGNVPVRVGRLQEFTITAAWERIDFIHNSQFAQSALQDAQPHPYYLTFHADRNWPLSSTQEFMLECETDISLVIQSLRQSENLYEQIDLLEVLTRLKGLEFDTGLGPTGKPVTVATLLDEVYAKASQIKLWAIIRRAAGLLDKVDITLSDAVTDILVRQKQIAVGKSYSEASLITSPMPPAEIMEKIREFVSLDIRDRPLTQEILIYLSVLLKTNPDRFQGLLTLRVGHLILLITSELALEQNVTPDVAYEKLMQLTPFELQSRLVQVIAGYDTLNRTLFQQESLHVKQQGIEWEVLPETVEAAASARNWWLQRQRDGALNRVPKNFYPNVWKVMQHCKGLVIGDKLDRRNRLDSEALLSEMTPGEKNFALRIEHLLNKIQAPEYRQVNIEALMELAAIAERNPELQIEESIVLDVLIGHAVRLYWLDQSNLDERCYAEHKATAWRSFYESSPYDCAKYIAKALRFLTELGQAREVA